MMTKILGWLKKSCALLPRAAFLSSTFPPGTTGYAIIYPYLILIWCNSPLSFKVYLPNDLGVLSPYPTALIVTKQNQTFLMTLLKSSLNGDNAFSIMYSKQANMRTTNISTDTIKPNSLALAEMVIKMAMNFLFKLSEPNAGMIRVMRSIRPTEPKNMWHLFRFTLKT